MCLFALVLEGLHDDFPHAVRGRANALDRALIFSAAFAAAQVLYGFWALRGSHEDWVMKKNIYVGNLSFTTTSDDLRDAFEQYGAVDSAQVVTDRETGRSRGFGFVEMSEGADSAISSLNGAELQGRKITVNEARPREDRRGGGGGAGGRRGG